MVRLDKVTVFGDLLAGNAAADHGCELGGADRASIPLGQPKSWWHRLCVHRHARAYGLRGCRQCRDLVLVVPDGMDGLHFALLLPEHHGDDRSLYRQLLDLCRHDLPKWPVAGPSPVLSMAFVLGG
jgi:hypothetical protein